MTILNGSSTYPIDRKICQVEETLSFISFFPIVGTLSGLAKIVMGVAQATFGAAKYTFEKDLDNKEWAWVQFKHGMGNILAGFLESVPVVGMLFYLLRTPINPFYHYSNTVYFKEEWQNRLMTYPSLKNDVVFYQSKNQEFNKQVQPVYRDLVSKTPEKDHHEMAREAIEQYLSQSESVSS